MQCPRFDDPSGFMSTYFQNATCDPYTPRNVTCAQGNYVEYAINVTCAQDVEAGLKFAQESNIRLVVKNTGHEWVPFPASIRSELTLNELSWKINWQRRTQFVDAQFKVYIIFQLQQRRIHRSCCQNGCRRTSLRCVHGC